MKGAEVRKGRGSSKWNADQQGKVEHRGGRKKTDW